ncbi:MAG: hypothetical protein H7070_16750 [Saprospiraceae bacterium]|nr:hypothetical protein [Pyrinomonadaceae bacterium]
MEINIMNKNFRIFFLALLSILAFQSFAFSQEQSSSNKYKPRTLSEIIELNRKATDGILKTAKLEEKNGFIGIDPFYSKVRVEYIGTPRPISDNHLGLITTWSKLQQVNKKFTRLYETEYLFKEGDAEYWIPLQKQIAESMNNELKLGDALTLFVIYVGAEKEKNSKQFESLFLSTAYEK